MDASGSGPPSGRPPSAQASRVCGGEAQAATGTPGRGGGGHGGGNGHCLPAAWRQLHQASGCSVAAAIPLLQPMQPGGGGGGGTAGGVLLLGARPGSPAAAMLLGDAAMLRLLGLAVSMACLGRDAEQVAWLASAVRRLERSNNLQVGVARSSGS